MAKEVKIFSFIDDREGREDAEQQLSDLVNDGWNIISSGGGNAAGLLWGFIILLRETNKKEEAGKEG